MASDADAPALEGEAAPIGPQQRLASVADSMAEFNRLLWEIAKSVLIVAAILFAIFLVFGMGLLVKYGFEVVV